MLEEGLCNFRRYTSQCITVCRPLGAVSNRTCEYLLLLNSSDDKDNNGDNDEDIDEIKI